MNYCHTTRNLVGTIGCLTAFRGVRTIVKVMDCAFFGSPQFEGNVGLNYRYAIGDDIIWK